MWVSFSLFIVFQPRMPFLPHLKQRGLWALPATLPLSPPPINTLSGNIFNISFDVCIKIHVRLHQFSAFYVIATSTHSTGISCAVTFAVLQPMYVGRSTTSSCLVFVVIPFDTLAFSNSASITAHQVPPQI